MSPVNILIVDGISQTGKHILEILNETNMLLESQPTLNWKVCCPFYVDGTSCIPDIFIETVHKDTKVIFPWENTPDGSL